MEVLFVVGDDLVENNGKVCLGQGSKETCLRAVELYAQRNTKEVGYHSIIVLTAGKSPRYHANLWERMAAYIDFQVGCTVNRIHFDLPRIEICPAPRFNTSGEMEKLAQIVSEYRKKHNDLVRVVIVTKWCHGFRCCLLWRYWRIRYGIWGLSSFVSGHSSSASWGSVALEYLVVIPWNVIRESGAVLYALLRWLLAVWWRMPT